MSLDDYFIPGPAVPQHVDTLADRVVSLSRALAIVAGVCALSLACNVWQSSMPSYSNEDRAALNALIAQLVVRK